MTFGALCALPLRLRDDVHDGWAAHEHARMCADVVSVKRTSPLAWLTYTLSGGVVSDIEYSGANGVGLSAAPTPTVLGTGAVQWDFPATLGDGYGVQDPITIRHLKPTAHGTESALKAVAQANTGSRFTVRTFTATSGAAVNAKVTVTVWASGNTPTEPLQLHSKATCRPEGRPSWTHDADIGDYGGDWDKENCETESIPYAWAWYRELGSMIGSMFTMSRTGEVHAKKLALARNMAGVDRAAERARNNILPRTADEGLKPWLRILGVQPDVTERRWKLRRKAAAKFAAILGPTKETVDTAISDLLGPSLSLLIRNYGTALATPPNQTFWPAQTVGPAVYNMGGGTWISERCRLGVIVDKPSADNYAQFLHTMDVQLFQALDTLLPVWADYYWSTSSAGFILDQSELDLVGLTPT